MTPTEDEHIDGISAFFQAAERRDFLPVHPGFHQERMQVSRGSRVFVGDRIPASLSSKHRNGFDQRTKQNPNFTSTTTNDVIRYVRRLWLLSNAAN